MTTTTTTTTTTAQMPRISMAVWYRSMT
jgi:hypothetical protein